MSEEAATDVEKEEVYLSDFAKDRMNCNLTLGGNTKRKVYIVSF